MVPKYFATFPTLLYQDLSFLGAQTDMCDYGIPEQLVSNDSNKTILFFKETFFFSYLTFGPVFIAWSGQEYCYSPGWDASPSQVIPQRPGQTRTQTSRYGVQRTYHWPPRVKTLLVYKREREKWRFVRLLFTVFSRFSLLIGVICFDNGLTLDVCCLKRALSTV